MSEPSTRRVTRFSVYLGLSAVAFLCCAVSFWYYVAARKAVAEANEARLQSFLLADELRQSSDDLTRMVRTYVVTGDPVYKQHYQDILDIRDGKAPRPADYQNVYWDLILTQGRPAEAETAVPLLELMKAAGFTPQELDLLALAKSNSDDLVRIETRAMNLVEQPRVPDADRSAAIAMLYDPAYHRAKAEIMSPIREFNRLVNSRTQHLVDQAESHAFIVRSAFLLCGALLLLMLWQLRRSLLDVLGGSLREIYACISRVATGDFSTPVASAAGAEDTVIGMLGGMQSSLATLDAERRESERALRRSEEHYRVLVDSANEGICVVQDAVVRFANRKLLDMAGLAESEVVGRPIVELVYPEDRPRVMDRYRKRLQGLPEDDRYAFRIQTSHKGVRWFETHAVKFEWEEKPAALSFLTDITERRETEDQLRQLTGLVLAMPGMAAA